MKNIWMAVGLVALVLVGCGEETDSRITDDDAICLKIIRNGGSCGSGSTSTATTTVTSVSTVTITSAN